MKVTLNEGFVPEPIVPWTSVLSAFEKSTHETMKMEFSTPKEADDRARAARLCIKRKRLPITVMKRGCCVWFLKEASWTD